MSSPFQSVSNSEAFKARNALFAAATPAEKRAMIAQDVIDQLNAGKYTAEGGTWAFIDTGSKELAAEQQVCDLIADKNTECTCCALGALMLSEISINDKLTVEAADEEFWNNSLAIGIREEGDRLRDYFSDDQIRLIEIAFELGCGEFSPQGDSEGDEAAVMFGEQYEEESDRLLAIMNNIIKNNGTFIP